MKIQFLNGGLANQTFQYIFARHYELSHPGEIMYMDDSYFALHTVHNGYELEKVFGVRPHMLSECFDEEVWSFILEERRTGKSVPQILCENGIETYMVSEVAGHEEFNPFTGKVLTLAKQGEFVPEVYDCEGNVYYHGYWINKQYFAKYAAELSKELRFPEICDAKNLKYQEQILNTRSVAIHIRRGDYVTLGVADKEYIIQRMIEAFAKGVPGEWHLFVFSDDIAWCKENQDGLGFHRFPEVTFVEGNIKGKNYIDLQLMSQCEAMILSNSAFSYLGALLNTRMVNFINLTEREI